MRRQPAHQWQRYALPLSCFPCFHIYLLCPVFTAKEEARSKERTRWSSISRVSVCVCVFLSIGAPKTQGTFPPCCKKMPFGVVGHGVDFALKSSKGKGARKRVLYKTRWSQSLIFDQYAYTLTLLHLIQVSLRSAVEKAAAAVDVANTLSAARKASKNQSEPFSLVVLTLSNPTSA